MNPYCPHCKKPIPVESGSSADPSTAGNPYFPFCSDRCQMADLYGWLQEQYRIPAAEQDSESGDNDPVIDSDVDPIEES
jgi:endogenous inhibitor of DNA gyrase (YacG/DUF329 family)